MSVLERDPIAAYQTSRASGVRTVTACGDPATGWPRSSVFLLITLVGVSSAHRTSSAPSAVFIASSNPQASRRWAKRSRARATNPADTGTDSIMSISAAVRSIGTLPSLANRIAAALRLGPYTTVPAAPNGGAAVVVLPQPQRRRGSR